MNHREFGDQVLNHGRSNDLPGDPEASPEGLVVRGPTFRNKALFLFGGVLFAIVTYALGTVIYEIELFVAKVDLTDRIDLAGALPRIFQAHLFTFLPWLAGATGVSVLLGNIFDRQVKFREKAEDLQARAEALAVTDGLTLLYNHRYFMEQLALELKRTTRLGYAFAVLFLDIDDFKRYNDRHGHLAGDDVLRNVALATKACVRETDIVARYGGEEIGVIAIGSDKEHGAKLAERIRERVQRTCPATVSIGVSSFPRDGKTADDLIRAADSAMYGAKGFGKNRVCVAPDKTFPPDSKLEQEQA